MLNLNNKGQSLVMFVLMIPIFLLILTLVYDVGGAIYEKIRLSNTSYMVIDYGLSHIEEVNESDLIDLIMKNTENMHEISVRIEDEIIEVELSKNIKGVIGKVFNFDLVEVRSYYTGKFVDGKKRIERIR